MAYVHLIEACSTSQVLFSFLQRCQGERPQLDILSKLFADVEDLCVW